MHKWKEMHERLMNELYLNPLGSKEGLKEIDQNKCKCKNDLRQVRGIYMWYLYDYYML